MKIQRLDKSKQKRQAMIKLPVFILCVIFARHDLFIRIEL